MSAWVTACARAGAARPTVTRAASATRVIRAMPLPPPRLMIRRVSPEVGCNSQADRGVEGCLVVALVAPGHQPLEPADAGEIVVDHRHHEHHQHDKSGEEHFLLHLHAEVTASDAL